jgi:cysteine-S-conjugate beta-lyase
MKQYNFDEIVDRSKTDCIKYDALERFFGANDILPLWVADTDFRTPDFIMEAIRERMEHEVLGYTFRGEAFTDAIINWVKRRHDWDIRENWISFSPGVVSALTVAVMTLTEPGDKIIVQPPVYFPFFETITGTGRRLVENPLKLVNGRYYFDLEDLEQKSDIDTRMLLLCNPHNPGGMVWKKEELSALEAVCRKKNIIVVSDEIHSDLLFRGETHIPWGKVSAESEQNSIVCMAPSKTFNVAGLSTSFVVIPNPRQKKLFDKLMNTLHIHMGNIPGKIALEAAYTKGDDWLRQLMEYVEGNFRFLENYMSKHCPKIKIMRPEATFLVWLDFREYGMNDKKLSNFLVEKARVGLNNGARFGTGGEGFQRINIGCPRSVLKEALERMYAAFNQLP